MYPQRVILLVALGVLGVVTVGSVVAYQRGAKQRLLKVGKLAREPLDKAALGIKDGVQKQLMAPTVEETLKDRTLETLRVGDVILEGERDWLITGTLAYVEEEDRWWLHHIEDAGQTRWLEVRARSSNYRSAFFEPATDIPDFGQLYDGLTHKGLPFRLTRRGDARVTADGEVQGRQSGVVKYTLYEGPGGGLLSIEQWGTERISLSGESVLDLDLMPGERPT